MNYLEESELLITCISEAIKDEAKEQKGKFLSMLTCTLGASSLENLLTGKTVKAKIPRWGIVTGSEETVRVGQDF